MIAWLAAAALAGSFADSFTGYALPSVAVDTDDGFGAGGRTAFAWYKEGYAPYKMGLTASAYVATSGYQNHRLRLDRVGLGVNKRLRVTAFLAFRQWLNDRYYGIGNGTLRQQPYADVTDKGDPRSRYYRYRLYQPMGQLTGRYQLADDSPWEIFGAINPKYSVIEAYDESLLEQEQPYGYRAGGAIQLMGGILHDTREPEIAPLAGHFLEASVRATPSIDRQAGGFGGGLLSARFYTGGERLVLAHRTMAEWLVGNVPFYEMVHWGGSQPIAGFGGGNTLRGVPFGRWRAPGKAVAQTELRWTFLRHELFDDPFGWELAPYVDVGAAFGAGLQGPSMPLHPGAGGALRIIWDETFVGRIDSGWGLDPVQLDDGTIEQRLNWGLYIFADHPF